MLTLQSTGTLNNGVKIPYLGLGVYKNPPGMPTQNAVLWALQAGYRHIDTAALYNNEEDVGIAVRKSGIPRKDVFITTKLWNEDQGNPQRALQQSLRNLGMEYVDLYLIHWPVKGTRLKAWKGLEEMYHAGKCRAIGVSNFLISHLEELLPRAEVVPAVNQVEFSPYLYQKELLEYCTAKNILVEAYSPLTRGKRFDDPRLVKLCVKYSRTPAQMLLRWGLQHGLVVLPKSEKQQRIQENADVYSFAIAPADMRMMDGFNENLHLSWDPSNIP